MSEPTQIEQSFLCVGDWSLGIATLDELLVQHGIVIDSVESGDVSGVAFSRYRIEFADPGDFIRLRREVFSLAAQIGADVVFERPGVGLSGKGLLVLDMDSTLIQNEMIDELALEKGVYQEVKEITESAMRGEMDFRESLRRRCEKLAGLPEAGIGQALSRLRLSPGAEALFQEAKKRGWHTALISGGFTFAAERLQKELAIDRTHANELEIKDGVLSGKIKNQVIDAERKADLLREAAFAAGVPLGRVVAVGDGANDLKMLQCAGIGIGYRPKPLLWPSLDGIILSGDLKSILPLL